MFNDPDFDGSQHAFCYVRVLEKPSGNWTTWVANSAALAPPADVAATVQHRGFGSPVWIRPPGE